MQPSTPFIDSKASWDRFRMRHPLRAFYRVPFSQPFWDRREWAVIARSLASGRVAFGNEVAALEREVCRYLNVRYALATNRGRSALELAFRALDLQPGDEVLLPSFICTGGVMDPIQRLQLRPVFVDVGSDLGLYLPALERAFSSRTRVLLICHLSGHPEPHLRDLLRLAAARNLPVIEDAAQAFGARIDGRCLGTLGDMGVLSFSCGKNLVAGGGMLVTHSKALFERVSALPLAPADALEALADLWTIVATHCLRRWTLPFGLAWRALKRPLRRRAASPPEPRRMANVHAAICRAQLEKADAIIQRQRANAGVLRRRLNALQRVRFPQPSEDHIYTKCLLEVVPPEGVRAPLIYDLAAHLFRGGIEVEWSYTPIPEKAVFAHLPFFDGGAGHRMAPHLIAIPVHPFLDEGGMNRIADSITSYFERWT